MPRALSEAVRRLRGDQRGHAMVEYLVLLTCIAVGGVLAWQLMGKTIVPILGAD